MINVCSSVSLVARSGINNELFGRRAADPSDKYYEVTGFPGCGM